MKAVQQALTALVQRPEVDGAALISPEGLLLASQVGDSHDAEALAALIVSLARLGEQVAAAAGRSGPERLIVETAAGMILASPLTDGALLLVLAGSKASVGQLLYDLRQMRGNLAALL